MYNLAESQGLSFNAAAAGITVSTAGTSFYAANAITSVVNGVFNPWSATGAAIASGTTTAASPISGNAGTLGVRWGTLPALSGNVPSTIGVGATPPALVADGVIRVIPNGFKCSFGLWLDQAGLWHLTQGLPVNISEGGISQTSADASMIGGPNSPVPAGGNVGWVLVAMITVANAQAGGATFTPLTTSFGAAGVTTKIYQTATLPAVALQ